MRGGPTSSGPHMDRLGGRSEAAILSVPLVAGWLRRQEAGKPRSDTTLAAGSPVQTESQAGLVGAGGGACGGRRWGFRGGTAAPEA